MPKLVSRQTVYIWPKDEETADDISFTLYTDEDYEEECNDLGVDTLHEKYYDNDEIVDEISASEDSYASSGEYIEVVDIPEDGVEEIQKLIDLHHSTENQLRKLFR